MPAMSSAVALAIGVAGNTVTAARVALVAVHVGTVSAESSRVVWVTMPQSPDVMPGFDPIVTLIDVAFVVAAWTTAGTFHVSPPAFVKHKATARPGVEV